MMSKQGQANLEDKYFSVGCFEHPSLLIVRSTIFNFLNIPFLQMLKKDHLTVFAYVRKLISVGAAQVD